MKKLLVIVILLLPLSLCDEGCGDASPCYPAIKKALGLLLTKAP